MYEPAIAVLIPCKNEAATIATVVADFRQQLPGASIYVYDNCSDDATSEVASAAGAIVRSEQRPGKGQVVCRMLADVEAEVYVLVDGDDTYDPKIVGPMVRQLVDENLDMVVGVRVPEDQDSAYRRGHVIGNRFFNRLNETMFGKGLTDVFSGYRVLSRRFVKSFPATSSGFEIEAEMTAHALSISAPIAEVPGTYRARADGTESKLRTYRDGLRILLKSIVFFKDHRPALFFGLLALLFTIVAFLMGLPVVIEFLDTGKVLRLPTALMATGVQVIGFISLTCGLILDSVARTRREIKKLNYLSFRSPSSSTKSAESAA